MLDWVILVGLLAEGWLLWDIRRSLRLPVLPPILPKPVPDQSARVGFPGAVPPERFVVIRWPQGLKLYGGTDGAKARQAYEYNHPAPGEEVEFWELGNRRGIKAA